MASPVLNPSMASSAASSPIRRSLRLQAAAANVQSPPPHVPPVATPPPRTPRTKSRKSSGITPAAGLLVQASTLPQIEALSAELSHGRAERRLLLALTQDFYLEKVFESLALDRTMRLAQNGRKPSAQSSNTGTGETANSNGNEDETSEIANGTAEVDVDEEGQLSTGSARGPDKDDSNPAQLQSAECQRRSKRLVKKQQTSTQPLAAPVAHVPLYMALEGIDSFRHRNFSRFLAQRHNESTSTPPPKQSVSVSVSLTPSSKAALWAPVGATHASLLRHPDGPISDGLIAAQSIAVGLNSSMRSINTSMQATGVPPTHLPPTLPTPSNEPAARQVSGSSQPTPTPYPTSLLSTFAYAHLTTSSSGGQGNSYANFLKRCVAPFTVMHGDDIIELPRVMNWHAAGPYRQSIYDQLSKSFKKEMSNVKRLAEHFHAFLASAGHTNGPATDSVIDDYLDGLFPSNESAIHKLHTIEDKRAVGKSKVLSALKSKK